MTVQVRALQDYCLTLGEAVVHLSEYKIIGGCTLQEQGTASGTGAVVYCFPKGTRVSLKGRLASDAALAAAAEGAETALHSGETQTLTLGALVFREARLIGYAISEGGDFPEITLLFYAQKPFRKEPEEESV